MQPSYKPVKQPVKQPKTGGQRPVRVTGGHRYLCGIEPSRWSLVTCHLSLPHYHSRRKLARSERCALSSSPETPPMAVITPTWAGLEMLRAGFDQLG